jgi:hypothetical protein
MVCSVVLVGVVTRVALSFRYVKREENEMSPTSQFSDFWKLHTEMMNLLVQLRRAGVQRIYWRHAEVSELNAEIRTQVASHRLLRARDRVQLHVHPRGNCGGPSAF